MSIQRQPKGIPVGGQFAANEHDEAAAELAEDARLSSIAADSERVSRHTYGGVVGEVNKEIILERHASVVSDTPYGIQVNEDADTESDEYQALVRDLDSLDDYPSLDDSTVSERENELVSEYLREVFDREGGREEDWEAALDKYRTEFWHSDPAVVESDKSVYVPTEEAWIESLKIEDPERRFDDLGLNTLGADYLSKNSEAVIGFFRDEYGADIDYRSGWDSPIVRTSSENEDGHDRLWNDLFTGTRAGDRSGVVLSKLHDYIEGAQKS